MIIRENEEMSYSNYNKERTPAFQLNKFQSEFNLSFNQEMAKIIAYALQNSEDYLERSGKSIPPPLFALLSRLEDLQKPKFYKDYSKARDFNKLASDYGTKNNLKENLYSREDYAK
jgi:hypothetical protein